MNRMKVEVMYSDILEEYQKYKPILKKQIVPARDPDFVNCPDYIIIFLTNYLPSSNYNNVMEIFHEFIDETYLISYHTLYVNLKKHIGLTPKKLSTLLLCLDIIKYYSVKYNLAHIQEISADKFGFKKRESFYQFLKTHFGCSPRYIHVNIKKLY